MTQQNTVPALIAKMQPEFQKTLPAGVPSERFTRIAQTAFNGNPALASLDRASLFKSIMQAAQDGLVLDGKEAALVPFQGKATYLPMAQGLVKKIRQHSEFASLTHGIIYSKEVDSGAFEYVKGDTEYLNHRPIVFGDRGEPVGAYAIVTMKDGTVHRAVLTKEDIEKRKNAGRAGSSGPWASWTTEMWIKTAIKAVYKIAPNSGDEAGVLDQVFQRDEEEPEDVTPEPTDDTPRQTRAAAAVKAQRKAEPAPVDDVQDAEVIPHEDRGYEEPPL